MGRLTPTHELLLERRLFSVKAAAFCGGGGWENAGRRGNVSREEDYCSCLRSNRGAQAFALASPGAQRVDLGLEPCGVLDLQVQRTPHFNQKGFYPREACRDGSHDGDDCREHLHISGGLSFRHGFDSEPGRRDTRNPGSKKRGPCGPLSSTRDRCWVRSDPDDYVVRNAVARLLSASSRVLRDVAIFMRMWLAPPLPYDDPAFMCTFAVFTK
jgi:hypothetical protein